LKTTLLRLHGWLGISAGLILAVIGLTGSLLAFEPQILRLINPGTLVIEPVSQPMLTPTELYARVLAAEPERRIQALTISALPDRPAQVVLVRPGNPKRDTVWIDPYSGKLLPEPTGKEVFRWLQKVHTSLLLDELGEDVSGAVTIVLVFMTLSGLYLRWVRRPRGWKAWFVMRPGLTGRPFLWQLHAVAGVWVFALFLFSAGTGLFWSYDGYRDTVFRVFAVEKPKRPKPAMPPMMTAAEFELALAPVWPVFVREAGDYATASLTLANLAEKQVKVDYVLAGATHDREKNTLKISREGELVGRELFAEQATGKQLTSSWKYVHTGQYWGWYGQLLLLLSSFMLPVFAYLGLRLYLSRPPRR